MYCFRMNYHVNFDPGGTSIPLVLVLLIVSNLQFNEVLGSASPDIGDERWQLRQEFRGSRGSIHRRRYVDSAALSPRPLPSDFSSISKMNEGRTNHRKEVVPWFKPDDLEQSKQHAIKSLSETFRNLLNKSGTNHDLAADVHVLLHKFVDKIHTHRTKTLRKKVSELNLSGRDERLEALSRQEPSSIHKGDIKKQDKLNWSQASTGLVVNARSNKIKRLVKREGDQKDPENFTGNKTLSTEKQEPSTVEPETSKNSVITVLRSEDILTSTGTPSPQQSTSDSSSSTSAQTTTQEPTTLSPGTSIQSTTQHLSPTTQHHLPTTQHHLPTTQHHLPTTHHHLPTTQRETTQRSPSTGQQLPNPTESLKVPVQSPTLQIIHPGETEESPTTDGVEESDVGCDGAQCYASRLPYHWTTDATWALSSMVFLISILTFFVLYTGLWKKRNPMSYPLESGQPPNPNTKINIAELLKTRLASIPRHLRSKRQVHRKRMNGRRYEELPLHQPNGSCNSEDHDYFEDEDEDDLYLRDEHSL